MKLAILAALLLVPAPAFACPLEEHPKSQPWSCEDYVADGEAPPADCVHEPGRDNLAAMTDAERLAIAEKLLCPNGVNDWTEEGPSCD